MKSLNLIALNPMKAILSALTVLTLGTPAIAGIHDFNPNNVRPVAAQPTHLPGECYATENDSQVCYMQSSDRKIVAAILDKNFPDYASILTVDCTTGNWRSFGVQANGVMEAWSKAICRDN
jgi:hypothetical protein